MEGSLIKNLETLGLSENEAKTYLTLARSDWITALKLSKRTKINRSTLYRILESLEEKGLIQTQIDDKTTFYKTTSIEQLKSIVDKKKEQSKSAEESFNLIKSSVDIIKQKSSHSTKVNVVKGIQGLQHLEYVKSGKKNSCMYVFDSLKWYEVMGRKFAEEIRQLDLENNVKIYELSSYKYAVSDDGTIDWTSNKEYISKCFQHRYLNPSILHMTDDIFIIDDTIHFYEFDKNDIVGIEIINKDIATMLRGIFKILWNQAEVFDSFGGKDL